MKYELVGFGMIVGLSLGEPKLNFIFVIFGFGLNLKG